MTKHWEGGLGSGCPEGQHLTNLAAYQLGQLWYQGVNFLVPGGKLFGTKFAVVWYQPG
eukprot:COSAG02_NODE_41099_length_398_cov_0.772575_1_plen_57_part_10